MNHIKKDIVEALSNGKIGVIPTDTLYGLVGSALLPKTVERIYRVRNRDPKKPCIILIDSYDDLKKFGVTINKIILQRIVQDQIWPGKVSIILPCTDQRFEYLTRGTENLAFRMPHVPELRKLIAQTGPLIAPSANTEGDSPASTIASAREYFGNSVDFYVDDGERISPPSKIIRFEEGQIIVVR